MDAREIRPGIHWMGAIDWDRRLFDSLIPLPDGTSYNAYLVAGSQKTALIDTCDPRLERQLAQQLDRVTRIDYIVAQHAEQDHSGGIPLALTYFPAARVVATPKGKGMLVDLLQIPEERIITVEDGQSLSLGDRTLQFHYTPWVHWPETMVTYVPEERILFTCDFFGAHIASSDLYVTDEPRVTEAAKRYYAEIMMPFRRPIEKNLEKIAALEVGMIAPSHGQIYGRPRFILDAYNDWVTSEPHNKVVIPYVSMHGSTATMVEHLVASLIKRGVAVEKYDLPNTDIGKLAMSLVDAGTIVVGTPTVLAGPHPVAAYAVSLANALKPKAKFASIVGSYSWGGRTVEQIAAMIPNLAVEIIPPVLCKGHPRPDDLRAIDALAEAIAGKHRQAGLK